MGRARQFSLMLRSAKVPNRIEYHSRILQRFEKRCIFPNSVHHNGLRSGFQYYSLTVPSCNTPGVPHSTTWGTQRSCSVGRAPQPPARFLSTIQSPFTTRLALLQAYSFNTRACTGLSKNDNINRTTDIRNNRSL